MLLRKYMGLSLSMEYWRIFDIILKDTRKLTLDRPSGRKLIVSTMRPNRNRLFLDISTSLPLDQKNTKKVSIRPISGRNPNKPDKGPGVLERTVVNIKIP
jgi:hypothetical protein